MGAATTDRPPRRVNGHAAPKLLPTPLDQGDVAALQEALCASTILSRVVPASDALLGDFVTTTSRCFIIGRTGLGKTMFGLAMAMGMAFGAGFLHWESARPARVLYIDGEMPLELLKGRIADAARRARCDGRIDLLDNLMIFSAELAEELAELFPFIGMLEPLNSEAGHTFIKAIVTILKPDVIIFDNVQSLLVGVQKEEETWVPTIPLINWLSKQHVGQVWIDHTGHSGDHQYGTSIKAWRFDALAIMTPLPEEQRNPRETAFLFSFDHPGKARRRMPSNWDDFAPHIIRLSEDQWTSEATETSRKPKQRVKPSAEKFHDVLLAAIGRAPAGRGSTKLATWEAICIERGLIDAEPRSETPTQRGKRTAPFRVAKSALISANWIVQQDETVSDLTALW